jgi:multisubunit Na+/H+ antiporter MnhB subunit
VTALLLAQAAATLALCGLVWFVQVVHYPLFASVEAEGFPRYEREHQRRTTRVVAPLMGVEALAAAGLVLADPGPATAAGAALVVALWLSTFAVQVPLHRRLAQGFDARSLARLVHTNWARTAMWSARGALVLWLLA